MNCSLHPLTDDTDNTSTSWLLTPQCELRRCAFISGEKRRRPEEGAGLMSSANALYTHMQMRPRAETYRK